MPIHLATAVPVADMPDPAPASAPTHVRYLDGLRGVAILAVLTVHVSQLVIGLSTPLRNLTFYGVRGVQLFFIVSGLTLTMTYAGRPLHLLNFAARRYFRIAPMFYAGALLYLALAATTTMPLSTRSASALDVAATFTFLHGWLPSAVNTVVPGGWSIAAEAMFYVTFPLVLIVAGRRGRMTMLVAASYLVAGATSLALRRWGTGGWSEMSFPFWLVQFPAFAGGCWLATRPLPGIRNGLARPCLALGIVGLVVDSQLRGHSNLLVAIALLTLVTWAVGIVRPALLEGKALPWIGKISFSLYIVHFAVLGLLHPLAPAIERRAGGPLAFVLLLALVLLGSAVISAVTYEAIERPFVRATRRLGLPPARPQSTS